MKTALYAVLAILAGVLAYQAAVLPGRAGRDLQARGDAIQAEIRAARGDLAKTQADLVGLAAALERSLTAQMRSIERMADSRLASLEGLADRHLEILTERADARIGEGIAELGRLRGDLRPLVASADELLAQTSGTVAVLRPQLLGLAAAGKVTLGETAQAARRVDGSLPRLLEIGEGFGTNLQRTTANVERITRPDKWWMTAGKIAAPVASGWVWNRVTRKK